MIRSGLLVAVLILTPAAVADAEATLSDDDVTARIMAVAQSLNSPLVEGQTLASSGTEFAASAIELIEEQVRAGQSDDEIREYFRQRYGSAMVTPTASQEADK
ncbi:cytochrome c-type biogenesis protein [Ponticaulis koreensis]|uniref:cytochrome c-type biogenesis protein n=1 Tax=Ponticaulis koreensis TaxID=1123045 RepID=UPI0003B5EAE9|nr:cytochrome c-type biogenesis protein CcmH [Ponticaulis koreensis]